VLWQALQRYTELRSSPVALQARGWITGGELVEQHANGTLEYHYIGRQGALHGAALDDDIATGAWRTRLYQASVDPVASPKNWMAVEDFIIRTTGRS
jgi:hypothetical protein